MKLSMEWLNNYVDLSSLDAVEFAEILSKTGLEVDGIENYGAELSHLVVGEVKDCQPMENSDHLKVTQVDVGEAHLVQIVCGAPNVAVGQKVMVALPGAILPGNFKIKKSKLRGVDSNGMLCSMQELGFKDNVIPKKYNDGIYILPEDAPVGDSLIDYLKLDDPILELDLTPNRADALSIRGAVYEIGAVLDQPIHFDPQIEADKVVDNELLQSVSVEVPDTSLSPHYQLRLIKNITITESPTWLQIRLMKSGIRPINNVVDVTNYFLMLYGQPMHAFDYDQLESPHIVVRQVDEGAKLKTLDQVERHLEPNDVAIHSGDTPIALAGVMGGLETEVTESTETILLEIARFHPERVRLTSKRLNLRSESSMRYEKGINPATVNEAGELAAALIAQLSGGQVVEGVIEKQSQTPTSLSVTLAYLNISDKLGVDLELEELKHIFDRLGFEADYREKEAIITIPPRRWDITIEADLLEEIARIYGYDRIPTTLPAGDTTVGELTTRQLLNRRTKTLAESFGLNEVISYVLTSKEIAQLLGSEDVEPVTLLMPISEEREVLRQSMFPAFMEIAQFNRARQSESLAFYEIGHVFFDQGEKVQPIEEERFAVLLSGIKHKKSWLDQTETYDFYDLKGMLEAYVEGIGLKSGITFALTDQYDVMHPGRTATIHLADQPIGLLGQIHPSVAKSFDLEEHTFFMELSLPAIQEKLDEMPIQSPIPRFPSTSRDIALLVEKDMTHQQLVQIIEEHGGKYLVSIELFDLYEGERIEEGKKSLAYHLVFQNPTETLTDDVIDHVMQAISEALLKIKGLIIR